MPHLHTEGMMQHLEDLQLSVLVAFVLKHLLDGHDLASLCYLSLEHNSERAISNDLLGIIGQTLLL